MIVCVGTNYSHNNPFEALGYYFKLLLRGDAYHKKFPWIRFDQITLYRARAGYIAFGAEIAPQRQDTTLLSAEDAMEVHAQSTADTDFALLRFINDSTLKSLVIHLPGLHLLNVEAHRISFVKWKGQLYIHSTGPREMPEALKI